MPNVFDQFDTAPATAAGPPSGGARSGNVFDQFDAGAPPTTTAGEAFGRGVGNAVLFNFRDELEGLMKAGGVDPSEPDAKKAFVGLARGAYRKMKGDPRYEQLYQEARDRARQITAGMAHEHPLASTAGELFGGALVPFGFAARAPTLGARAVAAAKTGAVTGALSGFGAGEGLTGSALGGAIGAPLGAGVGAAASGLVDVGSRLAASAANRVRSAIAPERQAERTIGAAYAADREAQLARSTALQAEVDEIRANLGRPGYTPVRLADAERRLQDTQLRAPLSPGEFATARESGTPVVAADILGEQGRALARSAANVSPEARQTLSQATQERYRSTLPRLSDWMKGRFGYTDPAGLDAAMARAERAGNEPAYQQLYRDNPSVFSTREQFAGEGARLSELATTPEVQQAMAMAQARTRGRAVARGEGYMPLRQPYVDEAGQLINQPGKAPIYPDMEFWDRTRRVLSGRAQQAFRTGDKDTGGYYQGLATALNAELDRLVPNYRTVRQGAAGFFGADNALDAGRSAVGNYSNPVKLRAAQAAKARMTEEQQRLFEQGYLQQLVDRLDAQGAGAGRTNLLNRLETSSAARSELELGLGRQGTMEVLTRLRVENVMDRMRGALGNSTTVRQLFEAGLAGGAPVGLLGEYMFGHKEASVGGALGALLSISNKRMGIYVNQAVARRVGELLASSDLGAVQRGIDMVSRNPTLRRAVTHLDNVLARAFTAPTGEKYSAPAGQFLTEQRVF
jgi:hypothetical protein